MTLLIFFSSLEYRRFIENDLAEIVTKTWKDVIENMRFALISPLFTVSKIENAIGSPEQGLKKVAVILLEAFDAVKVNLRKEQIEQIKQIIKANANRVGPS